MMAKKKEDSSTMKMKDRLNIKQKCNDSLMLTRATKQWQESRISIMTM
jgi:hypothetical protein